MTIQEVTGYSFGGKLYTTEIEAVKAALAEIGSRIVKEHHSNPQNGLIQFSAELMELLPRHSALTEKDEI